ncbi:153fd5b6-2d20-4e5c-8ea2-3d6f357a1197 [Thermothielavioides terrestris]
MANAI